MKQYFQTIWLMGMSYIGIATIAELINLCFVLYTWDFHDRPVLMQHELFVRLILVSQGIALTVVTFIVLRWIYFFVDKKFFKQ